MTPTNPQIKTALHDLLIAASLGYPVAWPGVNFDPPATGVWLEVSFFPNSGLDEGLPYNSTVVPRGLYQVAAVTRPGSGTQHIDTAAQAVSGVYSKGTTIQGRVRVIRDPYQIELESPSGDRLLIATTVEYSG